MEAAPPATWQELERAVARILQECGYDVELAGTSRWPAAT